MVLKQNGPRLRAIKTMGGKTVSGFTELHHLPRTALAEVMGGVGSITWDIGGPSFRLDSGQDCCIVLGVSSFNSLASFSQLKNGCLGSPS